LRQNRPNVNCGTLCGRIYQNCIKRQTPPPPPPAPPRAPASGSNVVPAIGYAATYAVPGSEITAVAQMAPKGAEVLIKQKTREPCWRCLADPPPTDPDCKKACGTHEEVKQIFDRRHKKCDD